MLKIRAETRVRRRVKCPLFMSDYNQNVQTDYSKTFPHQKFLKIGSPVLEFERDGASLICAPQDRRLAYNEIKSPSSP